MSRVEYKNISSARNDFPIFKTTMRGKKLAFLDSGASTQKPKVVIDTIKKIYENEYANIHRGVYHLSQVCTEKFEAVRDRVQQFIDAKSRSEIIFTRGTTESINLVAQSYGRPFLKKGDTVLVSLMEHHANIVPWQILRDQTGITLKVIPLTPNGDLNMAAFDKLLDPSVKLVSITQISNVLGSVNPVGDIIKKSHACGALVLVDGAQAVAHRKISVTKLNCDFYAFSSHKMYGPSGVGVLYGKEKLLNAMPPYQGGGDMISRVTFEKTTYNEIPHKFEAGTPAIEATIGMGASIDYLMSFWFDDIRHHEQKLLSCTLDQLSQFKEITIIGNPSERSGAISFVVNGVHPHDVGTILDSEGIAVRAGHHCAQPLMDYYKIPATTRVSFGIYNSMEDVDQLIDGLKKVIKIFG